MNPNLKSIQAIGSDGDEALQNAIEICFQDSIKLLCAGHKRENRKTFEIIESCYLVYKSYYRRHFWKRTAIREGAYRLCRQISLTIN